jgi:hypothetical protein
LDPLPDFPFDDFDPAFPDLPPVPLGENKLINVEGVSCSKRLTLLSPSCRHNRPKALLLGAGEIGGAFGGVGCLVSGDILNEGLDDGLFVVGEIDDCNVCKRCRA